MHTNLVPGRSNYGRYIVIEHNWSGSNYYSLYGHLSSITVKPGQHVQKGDPLAVMGYTGVGLNRERAHLHLELNLLLTHQFEAWHDAVYKNDPNHNGIYNGLNLAGFDIARLYLELRKNPALTIPQFLEGQETFYKVIIPRSAHFELRKLYPWMVHDRTGAQQASWEVSFARSGVPLRIEPSGTKVAQPQLSYVKRSPIDYSHLTRGEISGRADHSALTLYGVAIMRMLFYPN